MKVLIGGDLTKEELAELLQKVRDIEQRAPERHLTILVDAPTMSKEDVLSAFDAVKPPLPYQYFLNRSVSA